MSDNQAKFQTLLCQLFQFDSADLDFGIYRIMNHKRAVIERFITTDLPQAITEELERGALADKEVFLLRNLSRGSGIGFFEERGFYPDFILWIVDKSGQRIVFVEPHGMLHAKAYIHDDKARLHERLLELAREIGKRSIRQDIALDSYIISATPFDDLRQRYDDGTWDRAKFAEKHILFPEPSGGYKYMEILVGQLTRACT